MKLTNKLLLLFIVVVAIGLRFYNFFEIPFTHDEFSAIFRTQFHSFSELIEKGVRVDGHPAGIQVFLYYWIKIFGISEWVVKLPFILFGIFSVVLIFLIAKIWFNETVGLISAAFISTIQFTVIQSQIARPYSSGLFFTLLMVYFWSLLMKSPQKGFVKNSILFILSSALCAYNHHFSLLFAAIVWLSGLLIVNKQFLVKYLFSGIGIFILYIPHLQIFFHQLSLGGVGGWLAKPHNDYIINYISYIFNFSTFIFLLVAAIVLWGFYRLRLKELSFKNYLLFSVWFFLPFLIGFFYSKYVNAVLQYSVLIFSTPYLLFILFGHLKEQKVFVNYIIVFSILAINIYSLIAERQHYTLFYRSPYLEILNEHKAVRFNTDSVFSVIDSHRKITGNLISRYDIDTNFTWFDTFSNEKEFASFLNEQSKSYKYFYFGCLSHNEPVNFQIAQKYFPNLLWQKNYQAGCSFLFSKEPKQETGIIDVLTFDSPASSSWKNINENMISDSVSFSGNNSYLIDNSVEWGPTYSGVLNNIIDNNYNMIDISVNVLAEGEVNDFLLSTSIESHGQNIHWRSSSYKTFQSVKSDGSKWVTIFSTIKLSDMYLNYKDLEIKIFIWNNNKQRFYIDDFKIKLRDGNPVVYGLIGKI